jgi:hypothetical protein
MSISRNWTATTISGVAGYEIIVKGQANVGLLTVMPELHKRVPQGLSPLILQLNLLNANDASPEDFKPVQYNEKISKQHQYTSVEIFHNGKIIETIPVK